MPIRITGLTSGLDTEAIIQLWYLHTTIRRINTKRHRQNYPGSKDAWKNTEYEDLQVFTAASAA